MASLAEHVRILSEIEAAVVLGGGGTTTPSYDEQAAEIRTRGLAVVARRDRLLRMTQEFVAISAVVPFPIRSRFLSISPRERPPGWMSPGVALSAFTALVAAVIVVAAAVLGAFVHPPLGWLWLLALPVEAAGGFAYRAAGTLEPPNRWLGSVWRIQLTVLLLSGLPLVALASARLDRPAQIYAAVAWFVLGLAFVGGMYAFSATWPDGEA